MSSGHATSSAIVAGPAELDAARMRLADIGAPVQEREEGLLARDPSSTAVLVLADA